MEKCQKLLHNAHLAYQRQQLKPNRNAVVKDASEIRGVRFEITTPEWLVAQRLSQLQTVLTGRSPNFVKAFVETVTFMAR